MMNTNNYKKILVIIILILIVVAVTIFFIVSGNKKSDKTSNNPSIKSSEKRKEENNNQLKKEGIGYNKYLPTLPNSTEISLRSKKNILSRAIASYFVSNVAIDYNWHKEDLEESKTTFNKLIEKFNLKDSLIEEERIMLYGEPTDKIALNLEWTIESSKVLFWMLGFIDNLNYPSDNNIASAAEINSFLLKYNSFDEMLNDAKLLDSETILDYADLYYRYHWACVDKRVNGKTSIGNLSEDIVYERRRAFEWAINSEEDWYNFDAST